MLFLLIIYFLFDFFHSHGDPYCGLIGCAFNIYVNNLFKNQSFLVLSKRLCVCFWVKHSLCCLILQQQLLSKASISSPKNLRYAYHSILVLAITVILKIMIINTVLIVKHMIISQINQHPFQVLH